MTCQASAAPRRPRLRHALRRTGIIVPHVMPLVTASLIATSAGVSIGWVHATGPTGPLGADLAVSLLAATGLAGLLAGGVRAALQRLAAVWALSTLITGDLDAATAELCELSRP